MAIEIAASETLPIGTHASPRPLAPRRRLAGKPADAHRRTSGPARRIVLAAIEDAYVSRRYPALNKGTAGVLLVDGGDTRWATWATRWPTSSSG